MYGENGGIRERRTLTPQEQEQQQWWEKACSLGREEQIYLLCSRTSNGEDWVIDQPLDRRLAWVARALQDIDHEEKKYGRLLETMIKLLSFKA